MSNSSKPDDKAGKPAQSGASLERLWKSLAREWQWVAAEISKLGTNLSAAVGPDADDHVLANMQMFDLLHQQTLAQAQLMASMAEGHAPAAVSMQECLALIEAIPFEDVRQRLIDAVDGKETNVLGEERNRGEVDWL